MAEEITSGRFPYLILKGYMDTTEAVERALLEARRIVEQSKDTGIV